MWWYTASSNGNENAKEYIEEFEDDDQIQDKRSKKTFKRMHQERL